MAELTKGEIFREAQEKIKPITKEVEGRKKKLVENAAVIISFSVIALSIILYAFNTGYCKVFNLPTEVMSDWLNPRYNGTEIMKAAVGDICFATSQ